ncbi:putative urea ABC transporter substrate-binding protein [Thermodesulfobacteriota bacterium]
MKKIITTLLIALVLVVSFVCPESSFAKDKFKIAWSHYTGWEPYAYMVSSGILKKHAEKQGIEIEVILVNDYIESINIYTAGEVDGCTMTNMDALTIPAVGGVDSTALIVGDFSNGNDGIVSKVAKDVKGLSGKKVMLVELSVSHYLLARALDMNGIKEKDLTVVNTSDADIASIFSTDKEGSVVTWNPPLMTVRNEPDAKLLFDSSQIPGEIIDMLVVRTNAPDSLKKAMVGAWFETMTVMSAHDKKAKEAISEMATSAGGTVAEFEAQLKTTAMFYKPKEAVDFVKGDDVKKTMEYVRTFSFDHGLYGDGAPDKDLVGIAFPDDKVIGDKNNIKLRFDSKFMNMAAEGKL